jgi:hypothetical protein
VDPEHTKRVKFKIQNEKQEIEYERSETTNNEGARIEYFEEEQEIEYERRRKRTKIEVEKGRN